MSTDYETPFDDDFEMASARAIDKSPEEVEREARKSFPIGFQTVRVVGFDKPVALTQRVKMGDKETSYDTHLVSMHFASILPGYEKIIVRDRFQLIPSAPEDQPKYQHGKLLKKDGTDDWGADGREAKKLYHFLNALGFHYPAGGMLPDDARSLKNWVKANGQHRKINLEVRPARPYEVNGVKKDGFPDIKMFSYRRHDGTDILPGTTEAPAAPPVVSRGPVKVADELNTDEI